MPRLRAGPASAPRPRRGRAARRHDPTRCRPRAWREAFADALYGPAGFYRRPHAAARHFATAAQDAGPLADALLALLTRVDTALGRPPTLDVVDVGAGAGDLLHALADAAPPALRPRLRLHGVDLAGRPPSLAAPVSWSAEPPPAVRGLLVAHEWLDTVPVDVVLRARGGLRLLEVDGAGRERPGPPPHADQVAWLRRWWPLPVAGQRAEWGGLRDLGWAGLVRRLVDGVALAVDYPVRPAAAPFEGTLTAYRSGRQVPAVPDGTCDLTAHVQLAACAAAGRAAGASVTSLLPQREAMRRLLPDPLAAAGLEGLRRAARQRTLADPHGLGGFAWLLQGVGLARAAALP